MPGSTGGGSVAAAAPTELMPFALARAFSPRRAWLLRQSLYVDGSRQSEPLASSSRKEWGLVLPMTAVDYAAMLDFWRGAGGSGMNAFYFYDLTETEPKFTYDETLTSVFGLYTVRFDGAWQHALQLGELKAEASLGLIQVA